MIIKMKKDATKKQYQKLAEFLKSKNLEIRDVSSEFVHIFGIIGDTSSFEPVDLYAFEGVDEVTRVQHRLKKHREALKKKIQ